MIQDRTSVFPKAFTELTLRLSDVLKVALLHSIRYMRSFEWQHMESVIFLASQKLNG